jgi:hypothetical protein
MKTCCKKKGNVSEKVKLPINLTLKNISGIFQNTGGAKAKKLCDGLSRFLSPGYSTRQQSKYYC